MRPWWPYLLLVVVSVPHLPLAFVQPLSLPVGRPGFRQWDSGLGSRHRVLQNAADSLLGERAQVKSDNESRAVTLRAKFGGPAHHAAGASPSRNRFFCNHFLASGVGENPGPTQEVALSLIRLVLSLPYEQPSSA